MKFRIKPFGIAREIVGGKEMVIETDIVSVGDFRRVMVEKHPRLKELKSLLIAVNLVYAADTVKLRDGDEIAIIPPVSGG